MSIVKVDLRLAAGGTATSPLSQPVAAATTSTLTAISASPSTSTTQIKQTLSSSSPSSLSAIPAVINTATPAPLVKITLTPEGNRLSESSMNPQISTSMFFNSVPESTLQQQQQYRATSSGITQSNSNGSLQNRLSQSAQPLVSAPTINSLVSIGSSPGGTPLLRSLCSGNAVAPASAPTAAVIQPQQQPLQQQQQQQQSQQSPIKYHPPTHYHAASSLSSCSKLLDSAKNRKISSNSTEESLETHFTNTNGTHLPLHHQQQQSQQQCQIQTLQKRLEQYQLENAELREKLAKEKQNSQMIISENLQMKEALIKAQKRLKEHDQLQSMRVSQQQSQQHQRGSLLVSRSQKKSTNCIQSPIKQNEPVSENDRCSSFSKSGDFSSCDQQHVIESATHFNNRLSNHSILDILSDLRVDNKDQQNRSFYAHESNQAQRRAQLIKHTNKSICSPQQVKRRSEITPKSFTRFDAMTSTNIPLSPKKSFV